MRTGKVFALCAMIVAASLGSSSCLSKGKGGPDEAAPDTDGGSSATAGLPHRLAPGEVTEYHGKNLDPASSIPEIGIKGTMQVDVATYRLAVDGLVARPLSLRYEEVLALPQAEKAITLHCVEGWTATALWSGSLLAEIIDRAGPSPEANTVIFACADGYSTSLPLADIRQRDLILASKINGIVLPASLGFPFMVAAEAKWGYKWAKWVTSITLSSDPSYKGTWEETGYNVNGDEAGPRYESLPPIPERGAQ
jgi:DMSO/TMAO reductase YedYZ molybdopterin-dependent catalytic subunit